MYENKKIESVTATNGNIIDSLSGSSTTDAPTSLSFLNNESALILKAVFEI